MNKTLEGLGPGPRAPRSSQSIRRLPGAAPPATRQRAAAWRLDETVSSYAEEADSREIQKVADAFSECPQFTETAKDGTVSKYTISPMSFANLGDQALAFAMKYKSQGFTVNINVAWIVIGHNAITILNGGITGASGSDLEHLARKAVTRLKGAAS